MAQQTRVAKEESAKKLAEDDTARVYESEKDRLARIKKKGEELKDELDDLLDEIDAVLEEQEVLVSYRQRGGQ